MIEKTKIESMYRDAHQLVTKARDYLEKNEELTQAQRDEIDAWLQQADQIEKRAKQMQAVVEKDVALAEAVEAEKQERELKDRKSIETKEHNEFKSASDFIISVFNFRERGRVDSRLQEIEHKDLEGESGISGGFLIPTQQQAEILIARGEASFVRPRARIVPMGSRLVSWPALDYSQGAAGLDAFAGGVQVYWTEENQNVTASQPRWKQVELHARELAGFTLIPNGLLRDSAVSLEAFISGKQSFGGALGSAEDYYAINGDGAGKMLGVLNSPAKLTVTRNTSTDFKFVDAVTMVSKMLLSGDPQWVINQSVMPKLLQFADGASFNIFVMDAAVKQSGTLLGIPIQWTGKNPALGTQGDVMLIDWSLYVIGDRQQITMDVDRSFKFQSNQTAFRVVESIDGQPWLASTIKLMDGATTVSPYVVLN